MSARHRAHLLDRLGIERPILQAPMAGVQGSALALAVSNAGGLGALPCAMLAPESIRAEIDTIRAGTTCPYNVNFFCHAPPVVDSSREAAWRAALAPYYRELAWTRRRLPPAPVGALSTPPRPTCSRPFDRRW